MEEIENLEQEAKKYSYVFIVAGIAIVIVILAGFFAVKPLFEDNGKKDKIIENKKTILKVLKDKEEKLKGLSSKEAEIKEEAKTVLSALPDHKDKAHIYLELEGLASNAGLYLDSLSEATTAPTSSSSSNTTNKKSQISGASELFYTLELKGSYENLNNFLVNSQKALRLLKINSIEIKTKEASNNLDITLKLSTFYRGQESEAGNAKIKK